jgi:hypothetical protein
VDPNPKKMSSDPQHGYQAEVSDGRRNIIRQYFLKQLMPVQIFIFC